MSKNVLTTICVFCIAIIGVVIGFFLLGIEKIAFNYWALGSLLFSLVVSMITLIPVLSGKNEKVFKSAGISVVTMAYQLVVILSIVFKNSLFTKLNSFIFSQIAINLVFGITLILVMHFSRVINQNNDETIEKKKRGEYDEPKRGGF